jgi:replication initiation and membrane attachment protein DnaB|tara:strand:- start:49 stop:318 length:270 start_codon:yes stop_codon:yes gene_type:complete
MGRGNTISQDKVNKIHKDKKTMTLDTLAEKYRMTPTQIKYVLYKRKPKKDISYEELNAAMDKIDDANKRAKSIIKSTMETLNNLIPRRK